MNPVEVKYADRIAKLLRKAESTTPQEAEALVAKAAELMEKYAIDQAMLDAAEGRTRDDIEQRDIVIVGLFHEVKMDLTTSIANACGGKCVYRQYGKGGWWGGIEHEGKVWKEAVVLTVTAFRSDLDRIELLNASLQIQLSRAAGAWWKEYGPTLRYYPKGDQYRERKQFIRGFSTAVATRFYEATNRARAEHVAETVKATGKQEAEVKTGMELVLRSRKDQVKDWYDEKYGNSLRTVTRNYTAGSRSAGDAGRVAGSRADIGQPGLGNRKQLRS